jgi:fructokinase
VPSSPTVVGIGEILWDLLPGGRQLGGAPANFAYCCHLLGNRGVVASRVGGDQLGRDIRERLLQSGLTDQFLQTDSTHPTGTVNVELDSAGQPRFTINYPSAWDFLEWDACFRALADSADAVCFGSLAQRSPKSRGTILEFLNCTRGDAVRVFDVNLRQSFYSAEVMRESVVRASIAKLNNDEWRRVAELLGIVADDEVAFCRNALAQFELDLICVTRGANGSLLVGRSGTHEHRGFKVEVRDAVGAGDAFTAGLVHEFLRRSSLPTMNDTANRMGAWVASCAGAMPAIPAQGLESALMELRLK